MHMHKHMHCKIEPNFTYVCRFIYYCGLYIYMWVKSICLFNWVQLLY